MSVATTSRAVKSAPAAHQNGTPSADRAEIRRALDLLYEPGDVVELRAIRLNKKIISGYYDDLDKLADDAVRINRMVGSVYVIPNRINPALLARRVNRYEDPVLATTPDSEVIRRRWFLVDADPIRPSGISSNRNACAEALFLRPRPDAPSCPRPRLCGGSGRANRLTANTSETHNPRRAHAPGAAAENRGMEKLEMQLFETPEEIAEHIDQLEQCISQCGTVPAKHSQDGTPQAIQQARRQKVTTRGGRRK